MSIGKSDKFSQEEIDGAINCVKKKFMDFKGCSLTKLWYDETQSNNITEEYISHGRGSVNGTKTGNAIVLMSDFDVDSSGVHEGFNLNSTYSDWNWILIRDSKSGDWRVDDWGY